MLNIVQLWNQTCKILFREIHVSITMVIKPPKYDTCTKRHSAVYSYKKWLKPLLKSIVQWLKLVVSVRVLRPASRSPIVCSSPTCRGWEPWFRLFCRFRSVAAARRTCLQPCSSGGCHLRKQGDAYDHTACAACNRITITCHAKAS